MGSRIRKRSTAVTLVLAGSLAGCGEPIPQQDAYRSLADCTRDWGNPTQCQPVRDGRYSSGYYYGPSHFGSTYSDGRPKPSPNAMDAIARPKGATTTSSSSRSAFSGSSSSSSSSTSRSGFGSTASSHSSSGG
jgi:hypothetical protein